MVFLGKREICENWTEIREEGKRGKKRVLFEMKKNQRTWKNMMGRGGTMMEERGIDRERMRVRDGIGLEEAMGENKEL